MTLDRRAAIKIAMALSLAASPLGASAAELAGVRHDGKQIVDADVPGWKLVYFGYTHCPDVCPMSLQTMAQAIDALGPIGERMTPVFVTVDPERDTPDLLAKYVAHFHPRTVGIAPAPDRLPALAAAWRIKYARVEGKDGRDYTMDHTSTILLVDPFGSVLARLSHDLDGGGLANRIRAAMLAR